MWVRVFFAAGLLGVWGWGARGFHFVECVLFVRMGAASGIRFADWGLLLRFL